MEPMVKGYSILATSKFILESSGLREKLGGAFIDETTRSTSACKATEWYPRSRVIHLFNGIAKAAPSEPDAYSLLVQCGKASAEAAVQGYLKLLLKVLNVRMFASKFPDFWARDHQSGHAEVEMPELNRMLFQLKGIGGFDHIGPVSAGFIEFAMGSMGVKGLETKCAPWSLAEPAPDTIIIDVRWK